jgi:chromate transporter
MSTEIPKLRGLFLSFFRISAFTLGGGAVMLPLMEEEFVKKRKWISEEDMIDVYTLCQSLPGVIAINSSLMIGRLTAGFAGAVCAVSGVLLPSVIIITALASVVQLISGYNWANLAFRGVRAGVTALLLFVIIELGRKVLKGYREVFIALFAFTALEVLDISAILTVLLSALLGWFFFRKEGRTGV